MQSFPHSIVPGGWEKTVNAGETASAQSGGDAANAVLPGMPLDRDFDVLVLRF
jgi:hypothetical protein